MIARPSATSGRASAAAALLTTVALAAGCSTGAEDTAASTAASQSPGVVATTTQLCDYAKQLKIDADLTCILDPNASAHSHEMTREQMKALKNASYLLVSGAGLEKFMDPSFESSGFKGTMVVTSGYPNSDKKWGFPVEGQEKVDIEKWPFPPEDGETEPEFQYDPHVWMSPVNVKTQVNNIADALGPEMVKPENKDNFLAELDQYNQWAKESFATVPEDSRVLFTSHDAFGYFAKNFGLTFIGAALSDFNSQADATAEHIATAAQEVKDSGARAIFAETSNNPKSIEAVGRAAGVKVITGDDALYGDSLGPAGSEGETYIGAMMHNVRQLVEAWGGTVAPVPPQLERFETH